MGVARGDQGACWGKPKRRAGPRMPCAPTAPRFLMLDEPLEGLSPTVAHAVMDAVRRMVTDEGLACVLVEQHVRTVLEFCDRVMVIERGRCEFLGTPDALEAEGTILSRAVGIAAH